MEQKDLTPRRRTLRTLFQGLVAFAIMFPILVDATGLSREDAAWLAVPIGIAAAVARIMALPQVEEFLQRFVPWLAAEPAPEQDDLGADLALGENDNEEPA